MHATFPERLGSNTVLANHDSGILFARETDAPSARIPLTFAAGTSGDTNASTVAPRARAACARPWPKFPAVEHTHVWSGSSRSASRHVPRPLKLPIGVTVSFLITSSRPSAAESSGLANWGVFRKTGSIRWMAAAIRSGERSVACDRSH